MIAALYSDRGALIAQVYVHDPAIQQEAQSAWIRWAADYSTINGQNTPEETKGA